MAIRPAAKDIEASQALDAKFGFQACGNNAAQKWLIMKNGDHIIGLFQWMQARSIVTANPGCDSNARKLAPCTDVRAWQRQLPAQGSELQTQADESTTGPARFVAAEPDGNPILVDPHV